MKIKEYKSGEILLLDVEGRLDAEGANHLEHDLNDYLRRGEHHLRLGLEEINYISSAGIRVLMIFRKKLSAIDGSFSVTVNKDSQVFTILEMAGLTALLEADTAISAESTSQETFINDGVHYEIMERHERSFSVSNLGSSEKLKKGVYSEQDAKQLKFPIDTLTLGIGALGNGFQECRESFGEFIAAGGVAVTRPPGSSAVDYMLPQEKIIPEGTMISGLRFEGGFDTIFRFHPSDNVDSIPLTTLCDNTLRLSKNNCAVIAATVEVADIVGVALTKSPALKKEDENIFDFPTIRDWISFTGEPVYKTTAALLSGVVSKTADSIPGTTLPGIGKGLFGQFKAAILTYGPFSHDQTNLNEMTLNIFKNHQLLDLLHLVNDERKLLGVGESAFLRGTVWAGKVGVAKK